jgi:hypothetical protein
MLLLIRFATATKSVLVLQRNNIKGVDKDDGDDDNDRCDMLFVALPVLSGFDVHQFRWARGLVVVQ